MSAKATRSRRGRARAPRGAGDAIRGSSAVVPRAAGRMRGDAGQVSLVDEDLWFTLVHTRERVPKAAGPTLLRSASLERSPHHVPVRFRRPRRRHCPPARRPRPQVSSSRRVSGIDRVHPATARSSAEWIGDPKREPGCAGCRGGQGVPTRRPQGLRVACEPAAASTLGRSLRRAVVGRSAPSVFWHLTWSAIAGQAGLAPEHLAPIDRAALAEDVGPRGRGSPPSTSRAARRSARRSWRACGQRGRAPREPSCRERGPRAPKGT